jgi:hypothetical protein
MASVVMNTPSISCTRLENINKCKSNRNFASVDIDKFQCIRNAKCMLSILHAISIKSWCYLLNSEVMNSQNQV